MTRKTQMGNSGLLSGKTDEAAEIPCGAVAVAQGADDPLVRIQLEQALCALLGLPGTAVSVMAGGNDDKKGNQTDGVSPSCRGDAAGLRRVFSGAAGRLRLYWRGEDPRAVRRQSARDAGGIGGGSRRRQFDYSNQRKSSTVSEKKN